MTDLYADWSLVYDYFYPDRSNEVDFWARMAAPYGQRLLDAMCGTAEVSLGLARRDYRVLGVDLSPTMLAVGAERQATAADYPARNLSLTHGDASALPVLNDTFDFALIGGSGSFNHLDDAQAVAALRELCRVLRPGGGLGMELINPSLLKEIYTERSFGPFRPTPPDVRIERNVANRYEPEAKLFHIHQVTRYEIGDQRCECEESFALHVHQPDKVQAWLEAAGFHEVRFYGNYSLGAFDRWSSDLLVVAPALPD